MAIPPASTNLRERKKAKTRAAIQEQALRLFESQGYDATSVEEIAAAAEISPSTFFRYFPTKQAVVLHDSLDPLMIEAFRNQPANLRVIQALRQTLSQVFTALPAEQLEREMARFKLIRSVPALRVTLFDEYARNIELFSDLIAERVNRTSDDLAVRVLAGAIIGAIMGVHFNRVGYEDMKADQESSFDTALAQLEKGFPF